MALCVAKKVFLWSGTAEAPVKDVEEFLSGVWQYGQEIEVRLYTPGRMKKGDAREALREAFKKQPCDWEHGEYNFIFSPEASWHRFFWRGRQTHLTAAESLSLFRRLILGEPSDGYVLRNIRRRLGKEFLADVEAVRETPPIHDVSCVFPDRHERNRGKTADRLYKERRGYGLI
jgi:hypothetical protein